MMSCSPCSASAITCYSCGSACTGEVLKVQDRHFHIGCFTCKVCNSKLASGGYFMKKDEYYCSKDYHILFGTKCKTCGDFVEGRVVTALGHSYHPQCFTCNRCNEEIRSGTVVTYNDRQEILCQKCTDIALNEGEDETELGRSSESTNPSIERGERQVQMPPDGELSRSGSHSNGRGSGTTDQLSDIFDFSKVPDIDSVTRKHMGKCAGCGESIRSCQSLIALERHWHLFCFTCTSCGKLLTSEYMTRSEKPYCEPCYQDIFGVTCDVCRQFITGKVLEAGEKRFHPSCASCCKCNLTFGEGEDMCIAGEDIWHLDCERVKAAAGIRTDSDVSSEDSQSRSRTHSITTPSPTADSTGSRSRQSSVSSKLQMSRESSAGEPKTIYSLKELQVGNSIRLPRDVNRMKLEQHLSDEDFHIAFGMDRSSFKSLQRWKQAEMKKKANLF